MEYMATVPDKYFDLAIVDPPYGIGAENHAGNKNNGWNQWERKEWDCNTPKLDYFDELKRVSKNQIIWGANYMVEFLDSSMGWIVWDKGQRDFSLADGELAFSSFNKALRIVDYARGKSNSENKIHPTQKPIYLYRWLLKNYAKEGDKILDTHGGSMSSAIACHQMGFDLTLCELDKDYYEAGVKRYKEQTMQQSLFK